MRWNHRGHRVIYTSQSLSLATLELWVHIDPQQPLISYVAVPAEIPEDIEIRVFEEFELPPGWRDDPGPTELRDLGTAWLFSQSTAVARVPSVIVPGEYNYLLNPASFRLQPYSDREAAALRVRCSNVESSRATTLTF